LIARAQAAKQDKCGFMPTKCLCLFDWEVDRTIGSRKRGIPLASVQFGTSLSDGSLAMNDQRSLSCNSIG
jgi:hypothetical protein